GGGKDGWGGRTLGHLRGRSRNPGEWERGLEYCRRALSNAEAAGDYRLKVRTLSLTGSVHIQRGDPATGIGHCDRAATLGALPFDANMIKAIRGFGLVKSGDVDEGIRQIAEAAAWFASSRLRFRRAVSTLRLAEGHLRRGDPARARTIVAGVLADAEAAGYRQLPR